jgi:hypothetical protein
LTGTEMPALGPEEEAEKESVAEFCRHKKELLQLLRRVYERNQKSEPFNEDSAWRQLYIFACIYLWNRGRADQAGRSMSAAEHAKLLLALRRALQEARSKLGEAIQADVRGRLFIEWCEANGNPDFTDPSIELYDRQFDKVVSGLVSGLAALEDAALRAGESVRSVRRKPGRPDETATLPHGFIVGLSNIFAEFTRREPRVGAGPFAQFVKMVSDALGVRCTKVYVIDAIKGAKRRVEKDPASNGWGRPPEFDFLGGKIHSGSE